MRIFLGIKDVSGVAWRLRCGMRALSVDCDCVNLFPHRHADKCAFDAPFPFLSHFSHNLTYLLHIENVQGWRRIFISRCFAFVKFIIFVLSCLRYDAFVYFGGETLFSGSHIANLLHFKILQFLNKRVIMFVFGSEVRPNYIDSALCNSSSVEIDVSRKKDLLAKFERYCDCIVVPPSCAQLLSSPVVNLIALCLPHPTEDELGDVNPNFGSSFNEVPVVFHAPSEMSAKGTAEVRRIIDKLGREGLKFEYKEVSGVSRREVLSALAQCDFVIDQMYSDYPMASLATEAALFGKPAVVGGYYAEQIKKDVKPQNIPPSIYVLPENITDVVRNLISDRELRIQLSQITRAYACEQAAPDVVAKRVLRLISGDVPSEWMFDPKCLSYIGGFGLPRRQLIKCLRNYVKNYGVEALLLSENPVLEDKVKSMIKDEFFGESCRNE